MTTKLVTAPWVVAASPHVASKLGTIRDWTAGVGAMWEFRAEELRT